VEINEIGTPQTPEEKKKAAIIKNLSEALYTWDLEEVTKIANIVGLCLDKAELINKTLAFLSQSIQGTQVEEPENQDLDNE
jgi:endonuclease III